MKVDCPVVGIDVGKNSSYFCVLTPGGMFYQKPTKIANDAKGLTELVTCLRKAEETLVTKPAVLLESTGHYSERLVCLLIRNNFRVFLINPLQSHSIKNVSIRKVKTDKLDCEEIARLFFILDLREYKMTDDDMANLKILTRAHHHLGKTRVQTINQLTSKIDQAWPGFTKIFDVCSKTGQAILLAYPAPAQLLDAPKRDVVDLIRINSRRGQEYAKNKYKNLHQCARDALTFGTQLDGYFTCIKIYLGMMQQADEQLNQLETEINALAVEVPAVGLKSIPGFGPQISSIIAF